MYEEINPLRDKKIELPKCHLPITVQMTIDLENEIGDMYNDIRDLVMTCTNNPHRALVSIIEECCSCLIDGHSLPEVIKQSSVIPSEHMLTMFNLDDQYLLLKRWLPDFVLQLWEYLNCQKAFEVMTYVDGDDGDKVYDVYYTYMLTSIRSGYIVLRGYRNEQHVKFPY